MTSQIANAVAQGVTTGGRQAQAGAARQGQSTGSTFARAFKTRIEAALADMPEVRLNANSSDAERELYNIRAQLTALRDVRIGIDVSSGDARAALEALQERLTRLSAESADVALRVDAGAAEAQLAAFQAEVNRLDGQHVDVDVDADTGAATASLMSFRSAAGLLGPAVVPVVAVIAAGLGSIAAAGTAAAAGVGAVGLVAVPAIKQIGTVLQAQKAAQDAASQSTSNGAQVAAQAASRASQLAAAQQAVATAERNGARQIAQAQAAVKQARDNAAQAAVQAAQRSQQAARAVADAEDALADAQKSARQAQLDLTAARKQATQELQDLNDQLADSVLSQRDAEISLKEATAERNAVMKDSKSSALDRQKALLQYDQAVQRLKEQTTATARLKTETADANKAGVEGTSTYKNAQQQLAQAQGQVADRTQALKDAQADQARTATQNAQQLAEAQQRIADAQSNVAQAQQSAADSAASAQRQLQQAQQQTVTSTDSAAQAQAKYQAELAKLSPAARTTMGAYLDLRDAFNGWSKALQPQVMPIFTRALVGMRKALPSLTPLVRGAADAIGKLQDKASAGLKKPWWKDFKRDLQKSVKPAILGLGVAFGNVFKGIVGLIGAFLPHMGDISDSLGGITKGFADWGTNLKGSPEFERFLSFASDKAPLVKQLLKNIADAVLSIGEATAPISGPLLQFLAGLFKGISLVADKAPFLVQGIYALIVATKLWALAQWLWNAALDASGIPLLIAGIALLVLGVIYAYKHFTWFRTAVLAVWDALKTAFTAIGDAFTWLWRTIIKPYVTFMIAYWKMVGNAALWLWNNAIKPAFNFIAAAAKILATIVVVVLVAPLVAGFRLLAAVGTWLWANALKPAFQAIGDLAQWLWAHAFKPALQQIGDKAKWLYRNAIKPAWDGITGAAKGMWDNVLRPVFKAFVDGMKNLGDWAKWLWKNAIKPAWDSIKSGISTVYDHSIKPVINAFKTIVGSLGKAFSDAVSAIKRQWDKIKAISKAPISFVVNTVYNKGLVGVWNKVASAFGAPKLSKFSFAQGGVMPGYTPGRDVHKFMSPTGGRLELSGGESIFRPEFTRAVGAGFVGSMNSLAKSKGAQGVKAALAPLLGGSAPVPTDRTLKYADGGIFGWIKSAGSALKGAGSAAWNKVKEGAGWLKDTMAASARAGVNKVVNPLLAGFPGMDTALGKMLRKVPAKMVDTLFGYSKKADDKGAGGLGGPRIQAGLKWARTQAGLPYQWAGNGNPSWDCSGFMSAIESVIRGEKPHRRWATGAFSGKTAPPGWVLHGASPFRIGITNAGVGHTAGTIGGVNVESRGGAGVIVGKSARGYNDSLFRSWYGFKPGTYDDGGYIPPGMNLVYNGTGKPEPVFTARQFDALAAGGARQQQPVVVELHAKEDGFGKLIDVRVQEHDRALISVLSAS
ncbi:hypothetical protein [Streptomyces sp. NPDC008150]|uniref:hypothetical protein n=1 Tax=Streptomyces sp. NPDC008150 TaxID=3364816 RepID=UPI0036E275B4